MPITFFTGVINGGVAPTVILSWRCRLASLDIGIVYIGQAGAAGNIYALFNNFTDGGQIIGVLDYGMSGLCYDSWLKGGEVFHP